jgi:hypothetical protein
MTVESGTPDAAPAPSNFHLLAEVADQAPQGWRFTIDGPTITACRPARNT